MAYQDMSSNWFYKKPVLAADFNQLGKNDNFLLNYKHCYENYFEDFTTTEDLIFYMGSYEYPKLFFKNFTNNHQVSGSLVLYSDIFINNGVMTADGYGGRGSSGDGEGFPAFGGGRGGNGEMFSSGRMNNLAIMGGSGGAGYSATPSSGGNGGGMITIYCREFYNTGVIRANGLNGTGKYGGGGGGGRIHIFFSEVYENLGTISVAGGSAGDAPPYSFPGQDGTIIKINRKNMTTTIL